MPSISLKSNNENLESNPTKKIYIYRLYKFQNLYLLKSKRISNFSTLLKKDT